MLADSYDDQINALKAQSAAQQAEAAKFHAQADNYQARVTELTYQIAGLRAAIQMNQLKSDRLNKQIEEAKAKLAHQKTVLGDIVKTMYFDSGVSPLEMLASSSDIGEFLDQEQYRESIKARIQETMASIVQLQKSLEDQQAQLQRQIAEQQAQKDQVAQAQAEVKQLQTIAAQSAAAADAQVKKSSSEITRLKAEQAAALAAASKSFSGTIPGASGGSGGQCDNGHGNGGYPSKWCDAPQDFYQTPWGYSRECVSWAGWRRVQLGRAAGAWGNANTWDDYAIQAGLRVDNTPEVGAIAQTDAGPWGHVAVVEAVKGNTVVVSEMNYDGYGHFRYGTYSTSYYKYIH